MLTISRTRLLTGAAALALTTSLGATPGLTQETDSATMNVSASVAQECTVASNGDLVFGIVDLDNLASETADATFTVNCTLAGSVDIDISRGNTGSLPRRMWLDGNDVNTWISYDLFEGAGGATWDSTVSKSVGSGDTTFNVHGALTGTTSSELVVGDYSDTVTITVTFNG